MNSRWRQSPKLMLRYLFTLFLSTCILYSVYSNSHAIVDKYETFRGLKSRISDITETPLIPDPQRPYLIFNEYEFPLCPILRNATFYADLLLPIHGQHKTIMELDQHTVGRYIEEAVERILHDPWWQDDSLVRSASFWKINGVEGKQVDPLLRAVCFRVALGNENGWHQISERLFLRTIDPYYALPPLAHELTTLPDGFYKPRFRLAYAIMAYESLHNVLQLIRALIDNDTYVLVHVDANAPPRLYTDLVEALRETPNADVLPTQFYIIWGHISIVWAELALFFGIEERIDFDYVVNLSESDYPLKTSTYILENLDRLPEHNWLYWTDDKSMTFRRIHELVHCRNWEGSRCNFHDAALGQTWFSLAQYLPVQRKTSQWMILPRSTVQFIREYELARLFLLHAEHLSVPDEIYFGSIIGSTALAQTTVRDNKRLISFLSNEMHPRTYRHYDLPWIKSKAAPFFYTRKIHPDDPDIVKGLDALRKQDVEPQPVVHIYNKAEGIVPLN